MAKTRVRTPTLIQMEAVECGAASLGIVLGYFKKYIPLEELRLECGISRDGSNALNLIKAAKKYGLTGNGYRKEVEELKGMPLPAILFWNFEHFLVLEGFSKKKVFLNDPATGPRSVSYEEFDRSYTGIVLTFSPNEAFQPSGSPPQLRYELMRRLKPVFSSLVLLFLIGICLLLPGFALPAFTRIFVDNILTAHEIRWPLAFLGGIFFALAITFILTSLQQYVLNRLNTKLALHFSSDFLWKMLRLPVSFYSQRFSGEIAYRTGFNEQVAQTVTGILAPTCIDVLLVLFYGVVLFQYSTSIASIALITAFLNLTILALIQRSRKDAYARLQQEQGKLVSHTIETIQNIELIKVTAGESDSFVKFSGYYTNVILAEQEIGKKDALLATCPTLLQSFAIAAFLGIGSLQVLQGNLTIGMLMALQTLLLSFLAPIGRFINFGQVIQTLHINLNRLDDVLKCPVDPVYTQQAATVSSTSKLEGTLEFKNVSFGYSPLAPPLIQDLSFVLKPGMRIALVGPSGCGKSTVARLASGLYHPWSGSILYDGKPRKEIESDLFCRSVASVEQESFFFSGTVLDNLTFWNRAVEEERIVQACRDASIHEELLARDSRGYGAPVLEMGRNLSGGEQQRLEIARAFLFSPSLLILDEATSSLDMETERKVSETIRRRGCSCLMSAHRLSTIQGCDEILVLDEGRVIQRGTHDALKNQPGLYQDLLMAERVDTNG